MGDKPFNGRPHDPTLNILSIHPDEGKERAIEVKSQAGIGNVGVTENEWIKACNLREQYWLYVVFECATPHPRLLRIQDPFEKLLVRAKGGVVIDEWNIVEAAEDE